VPTFATALRDDDAEVRAAAADGLSNVDNLRTAPPELVRAMEDANDEVRHRVAHALGHIQDPTGLPALVAHVRDRNVEVRRAVVEALQGFEDESATSALRTALRDADAEVRESAARALGERSRK
jgi:HEAT repeat protein